MHTSIASQSVPGSGSVHSRTAAPKQAQRMFLALRDSTRAVTTQRLRKQHTQQTMLNRIQSLVWLLLHPSPSQPRMKGQGPALSNIKKAATAEAFTQQSIEVREIDMHVYII